MTEALLLRPLAVEDADAMVEVLADPGLYEFTGGEPPTLDALRRRYAAQAGGRSPDGSEEWLNWIVLLGEVGTPVGYVQATVPIGADTAQIAWVIGMPWHGRGLGRRAALSLRDELAGRGVQRLVAHIRPGHVASERVATALGMGPSEVFVDDEREWTGPAGRSLG